MTIIDKLIKENFTTELTDAQRKTVVLSTLRHILRIDNSSQHKAVLRKAFGADSRVIGFQAELSNQGYVLKNLKLFLLYMVGLNPIGNAQLITHAKEFKLELKDAKLIWLLKKDAKTWKQLEKVCGKVEEPLTVKTMDALLISVNNQLYTYTSKFAGKKLRFATLGSHLRIEDIASELRMLGLQGLMKAYPQMDSELHALNIAKRTIHNQGINLIHYYTSQRKSLLVKEADGTFTSLKVSLDVFDDSTGPSDSQMFVTIDGRMGSADSITEYDLSITYSRLIKAHKGRERKFIKLLAGNYSGSFSRWLAKNTTYTEHNDDLYERLQRRGSVTRYINLATEFLDMSKHESSVFLRGLREELA